MQRWRSHSAREAVKPVYLKKMGQGRRAHISLLKRTRFIAPRIALCIFHSCHRDKEKTRALWLAAFVNLLFTCFKFTQTPASTSTITLVVTLISFSEFSLYLQFCYSGYQRIKCLSVCIFLMALGTREVRHCLPAASISECLSLAWLSSLCTYVPEDVSQQVNQFAIDTCMYVVVLVSIYALDAHYFDTRLRVSRSFATAAVAGFQSIQRAQTAPSNVSLSFVYLHL